MRAGTLGSTQVVTSYNTADSGNDPTGVGDTHASEGSYFAVLNSTDGVPEDQLESFLGVDGSAIDAFFIDPGSPGFAFNGSAMKITLDVVAGDTISFDWYFDGGDEAPFLDSSFVLQPDGQLFELADVGNVTSGGNEPLIWVGDFGDSGWQIWNWTVQQTGTIQIGFGVVNDTDNENNSALYIDNVTLVKAQNHLVDADDDLFTTAKNSVLHANVLANDSAPDGVFSVTLVPGTEPEFGTLELNNDGTFSFDPGSDFDYLEPGELASISFDYEVTDTNGDTDIATANITVSGGEEDIVVVLGFETGTFEDWETLGSTQVVTSYNTADSGNDPTGVGDTTQARARILRY